MAGLTPLGVVIDTVTALGDVIQGKPVDLWRTLSPLLLELGMSQAIVTDETRDKIQREVHHLLRGASLIREADLP